MRMSKENEGLKAELVQAESCIKTLESAVKTTTSIFNGKSYVLKCEVMDRGRE